MEDDSDMELQLSIDFGTEVDDCYMSDAGGNSKFNFSSGVSGVAKTVSGKTMFQLIQYLYPLKTI